MQQWEYFFVALNVVTQNVASSPHAMGAYFDNLGLNGWELVSTTAYQGENMNMFFFKRPHVAAVPPIPSTTAR